MNEKAGVMSDRHGWSVNLDQATAVHESGFRLTFSGHPGTRNFDIQPSGMPVSMGALEWARLLRQGTDLYRQAFGDDDDGGNTRVPAGPEAAARKPVITVKRRRQVISR